MGIVVQLGHSQCLRIEGDQVKLAISTGDGEDSSDCIVRSIGFNGDLPTRLEVSKDGSCSKGLLQSIERLSALVGDVPRGIFASKPSCHDCAQPLPRPSQYSDPSPATPKLMHPSSIPDATPIPSPGLPRTFFLARSLV